jgi:hypothetical protein
MRLLASCPLCRCGHIVATTSFLKNFEGATYYEIEPFSCPKWESLGETVAVLKDYKFDAVVRVKRSLPYSIYSTLENINSPINDGPFKFAIYSTQLLKVAYDVNSTASWAGYAGENATIKKVDPG